MPPVLTTTTPTSRHSGNGRSTPSPPDRLRILFVASECVPFAKTGGLADVVAGLPKALRQLGHDARILIPLYSSIDRAKYNIKPVGTACVHMGAGIEHWVAIHHTLLDDEVPVWFLEFDAYFGRPGIYDGPLGHHMDNAFRFGFLSKAALQICKDFQFIPHIMHAHDWPTAILPALLKTWDRILSPLSNTASVLTIHNIGYQGKYDANVMPYLGLGAEHFTPDKFEDFGKTNLLKGGIAFADALTTVSPTHATEILGPIGGQGLAMYLNNRRADLFGILNGADYSRWNPATDPLIPAPFSPHDLTGKAACKAALQRRFNLEVRPDLPVFGIVSRFAHQKGFNLLREALPPALNNMLLQLVILGSGDTDTENFVHWLSAAHPGRVGSHIGYSDDLSHLIEAGSDFFLMPSLYEPCGLNQIYSLKYATLPVVRATGGLDDTVANYSEAAGTGTGFKFWEPSGLALYWCIGWAVSTWFDRPHHITALRQQAMSQNFDWATSARQYISVYHHALKNRVPAPA